MRAFLALLLSLILTLASQAEAVARSEMAGASDQVLCGAEGAMTVTLDASGHELPHAHPCTHCLAAAALAHLDTPPSLAAKPLLRGNLLALPADAPAPVLRLSAPSARAPPLSVPG